MLLCAVLGCISGCLASDHDLEHLNYLSSQYDAATSNKCQQRDKCEKGLTSLDSSFLIPIYTVQLSNFMGELEKYKQSKIYRLSTLYDSSVSESTKCSLQMISWTPQVLVFTQKGSHSSDPTMSLHSAVFPCGLVWP